MQENFFQRTLNIFLDDVGVIHKLFCVSTPQRMVLQKERIDIY